MSKRALSSLNAENAITEDAFSIHTVTGCEICECATLMTLPSPSRLRLCEEAARRRAALDDARVVALADDAASRSRREPVSVLC